MSRPSHPFNVRHRDVLSIALPATLAFITEPLAGLVDLTVIGRLGDAGLLGGTVLGGLATALIFSLVYFLRLGTAGLTAQSIGAQERDDGLVHLARASILGLLLGALALVFSTPLRELMASFLAPPPEADASYKIYFDVRMWSVVFVALNNALLGWFYGRAAATTGMLLQLLIHGVNIVASIILVYLLGWGVFGVALGTVLGQIAAALVGFILVIRHYRGLPSMLGFLSWPAIIETRAVKRLFNLSRDLTIRTLALHVAFAWFTAQTSRLGAVPLAANELLIYFTLVTAYLLDGQAQAAEQLCGKAVGANYRPAFDRAVKLAMLWGMGIGLAMFLFWLSAGGVLIDFMSTNTEIRAEARTYLALAALTAFTGVAPFILDGVTQGATLNTVIRNGMLASTAIYLVAAIVLQPVVGLSGLWIALHLFFVARGILFWFGIRRKLPGLFDSVGSETRQNKGSGL